MSSVNKISITNNLYERKCRKGNKSQKIMQTQTQEILSWFGPLDLYPVPKQPCLRFSFILDFVHPKSTPCTPLDKITFTKSVQLFLH